MSKAFLPAVLATALGCVLPPMLPAQAAPVASHSQAPTPLDHFLNRLHTLRVTFRQTLVDAHGSLLSRSAGTLVVERPGKFRWSIHPLPAAGHSGPAGAGQLMVADGRNLWFYDRDLAQVTVQPVSAALSATPAMLLSGTVQVRSHFTERMAGRREGLTWVFVEPKRASGADFRSALFGFEHGTLKRMILEDTLGQEATIVFEHVTVNGPLAANTFVFTPPKGVDVIGKPAQ